MGMRPDILTVEGDYFNYVTPETSVITIEAIAHGLANTCRFVGQCSEFYSVAQHSVACSYLVPPADALAALMHDAAEAYVGDMAAPLKMLLPSFKQIEQRVERAIFARFGIDPVMPTSVKIADVTMLATEQRDLMHSLSGEWHTTAGIEPSPQSIHPWQPHIAKAVFLQRYHWLTAKVNDVPRCGDTIVHNQLGEQLLVAWCDGFDLANQGWPLGVFVASDCTLIKRCSDSTHVWNVKRCAKSDGPFKVRMESLYPEALAMRDPVEKAGFP